MFDQAHFGKVLSLRVRGMQLFWAGESSVGSCVHRVMGQHRDVFLPSGKGLGATTEDADVQVLQYSLLSCSLLDVHSWPAVCPMVFNSGHCCEPCS